MKGIDYSYYYEQEEIILRNLRNISYDYEVIHPLL